MKKIFMSNMTNLGLLNYIETYITDSTEFANILGNESVDFCFVDASHVAEDVERDIEAWWPKIKPGGTLGGHDYSWGSVKSVTSDFARHHGLKLIVDMNCWKLIK